MSHSPAECATCPAHSLPNLVKLGVDMENWDYVVALAGNPNTGKSTVFNALTGLRQHTGNWPGKTVVRAEGGFSTAGDRFKLVDLPGTYSLRGHAMDPEGIRLFDTAEIRFSVEGESREMGMIRLPHSWG